MDLHKCSIHYIAGMLNISSRINAGDLIIFSIINVVWKRDFVKIEVETKCR